MHFTHISAQQKHRHVALPNVPPTPTLVSGQTPTPAYRRFGTSSFLRKIPRSNTTFIPSPKGALSEHRSWETPLPAKYREIWQRVRAKLKSRLMLKNLRTQLNLYGPGASTGLESTEEGAEGHLRALSRGQETITVTESKWIIRPDSGLKQYWDLFSSIAILYIAVFLPFTLAFEEDKPWVFLDYGLNCFFFIELLLTCNLAYAGDEGLVTSRKAIFISYFKSWFFPDLLACIPFEVILASEVSNRGVLRMTNLYRFIRLTKVLKVLRNSYNNRFFMRLQDFFHLGISGYRLLVTLVGVLLVMHFVSCMWVFIARMEDFGPGSWPAQSNISSEDKVRLYIAAFYWTVTSFTTVGYGDIAAQTDAERVVAVAWMLTGVYFFSYLLTTLTNLISNSDTK